MTGNYVFVIIILVLVLIIIGAIAYGVYRLKKAVRRFSRTAWNTDSVSEGIKQMEKEYASTPKSVSAMTSLYLPQIVADFPDFHYDEMKKRSQNVLTSFLLAVHHKNAGQLAEGNSELKEQLWLRIEMLNNSGQKEFFENIRIHRTEIYQYLKSKGRCIITFQSSIQYIHYIINAEGTVISGSKDTLFQSKYDVDLIYIQDRDLAADSEDALGINCPNCGAPITSLGEKFCSYCGSGIVELNIHAWTFSSIREL